MSDDTDALGGGLVDTAAPVDAGTGAETTAPDTTSEGKAGATILDGAGSDKPVAAPADWPEDWRIKLAGEDKSYLKTLDRFNSPADLAKAYRDAQKRLSAGNLKASLPENPTEEELKAWRAENGVPASPKEYDVNLGEGFVWSEADQPMLDSFTEHALKANLPNSAVKQVLGWYAAEQERQASERAQRDQQLQAEAQDNMIREWGNEYTKNLNLIRNALAAHATDDLRAELLMARSPSGRLLGDHPGIMKMLASMAREANPGATVVPSSGFSHVQDELKALESKMGEMIRNKTWHSSPESKRYNELLEAKMASENRGRAA